MKSRTKIQKLVFASRSMLYGYRLPSRLAANEASSNPNPKHAICIFVSAHHSDYGLSAQNSLFAVTHVPWAKTTGTFKTKIRGYVGWNECRDSDAYDKHVEQKYYPMRSKSIYM